MATDFSYLVRSLQNDMTNYIIDVFKNNNIVAVRCTNDYDSVRYVTEDETSDIADVVICYNGLVSVVTIEDIDSNPIHELFDDNNVITAEHLPELENLIYNDVDATDIDDTIAPVETLQDITIFLNEFFKMED